MQAIMDRVDELRIYRIKEVEVFSVGKWNDDEYSISDLHAMVDAFRSLKNGFRPYLKLGHNDKQEIVKSSGMPSIGWVSDLRVHGTKLIADLENVPEKIYKLIKAKAYRKVSCEIYWNLEMEGNKYSRVLGAIALLGAEQPGVMNLDDILGNYTLKFPDKYNTIALFKKDEQYKSYSIDINSNLEDIMADEKTEKEIKLETELEATRKDFSKKEEELKKLADEKLALEKETAELKKFKLEADERAAKAQAEAEEAKREKFVTDLEGKKLVTPAMKAYVNALLVERKEYSISGKDGIHTKEDVITELLKLASEASKVNFEESSRADYAKSEDTEEEIQKYMKENKDCNYVQAAKAVMKSKEK